MEITIDNYFEKESEIKEDIKNCNFLSFDLEMTGIAVGSRHLLDSPNERYLKHKSSAEKFKIIQFGLVPWFKKVDPNNKEKIIYEAKPYNIYVFPGKEMEHTYLNCEVSALIFNSKHGMNFNTWIYKGVNYLNNKNYTNLLLRKKNNNFNTTKNLEQKIFHKAEDKLLYEEFEKKFYDFYEINDETNKIFRYKKLPIYMVYHFLAKIGEDIRNKIYVDLEKNEENSSEDKITIQKVTKEERDKLIEESNIKFMKQMEKARGVSNIWEEIVKNKKILIGHNLSIDILFCFSHFGESLPDSYDIFKKLVTNSFAGLYDTKYLYNNLSPKDETKSDLPLEGIYEKLTTKFQGTVNVSIPEGFTNYLSKMDKKETDYHQADFDAFITGLSFCYLYENYIGNNKEKDKLMEFHNYKVHFMKTFYKNFDFKNYEEFLAPNTIPYCLRSMTKTCDFNLEQIVGDEKLYALIKEKIYIENSNAMLILIDTRGDFQELEAKLMDNNQKYFSVMQLEDFKKILKEEELQRNNKFKIK